MSAANTQAILDQLRALIPNAKPVNTVSMSRTKRDTLEEARKKVAQKLRDNIAYHNGTGEKVDLVYKPQGNEKYAVGIKYGNRYLVDAIGGGTFVPNVTAEVLPQVLEMFVTQVEAEMHDDAIEKVMRDNVNARNKEAH
jgi:hypothetical protein